MRIEHIDDVNNLDEILSVKGIDASFICPIDLSASMGIMVELDHPEIEKVIDRILQTCFRKNVLPGIHIVQPNPAQVSARIRQGFNFFAYSVDITIISTFSAKLFNELKS